MKNVLAGLALAAGLAVGAQTVSAATPPTYTPEEAELVVSDTTVAPGATLTATHGHWQCQLSAGGGSRTPTPEGTRS